MKVSSVVQLSFFLFGFLSALLFIRFPGGLLGGWLTGCGPIAVQIKQEVWQCEVQNTGENGTVNFEGCRRDGSSQDVQDSDSEGGPDVKLLPPREEPTSSAPIRHDAMLN